jgi:hypothetical protein
VKERGFEVLDMLTPSVPPEISSVEQLKRNTYKHQKEQFQYTAILVSSGVMYGRGFAQGVKDEDTRYPGRKSCIGALERGCIRKVPYQFGD